MHTRKNLKQRIKEGFICVLITLILCFFILNFVARFSIVQGSSMKPLLETNNRIAVDLVSYHLSAPSRGDVVVFECPYDSNRDYIKRIVGLPGERIEIKEGRVYIDGRILDEPYAAIDNEIIPPLNIPADHYYLLGDNRRSSEDSRRFGAVPRKKIKGKASLILWPPAEFETIK